MTLRPESAAFHAGADDEAAEDAKPVWTQLYVDGLCCPAEAPLIHRILTPLSGVHEVSSIRTFRKSGVSGAIAADCNAALAPWVMLLGLHSSSPRYGQQRAASQCRCCRYPAAAGLLQCHRP